MKYFYISFLLFLLVFAGNKSYAQYIYDLEIELPFGFNGKKFIWAIFKNDARKISFKDSSTVDSNRIRLVGLVSQVSNFASLAIKYEKKFFNLAFVLDSGKNKFIIEKTDENKLIIVSGKSFSNILYSKLDSVKNYYYNLYKTENKLEQGFALPTELQQMSLKNQINILKINQSNYFSLIALNELSLYRNNLDYLKNVMDAYQALGEQIKSAPFAKEFSSNLKSRIENLIEARAGKVVKSFTVLDASGKKFSNQSLQGQNYIIVFSATWCLPCQKQLPMLKKIYQNYQSKGLKVIYFNQDDDVIRWKKHIADNKLSWINVSERVKFKDSKISEVFGVTAVPTCFVVNKLGHIVYNSEQSDTGLEKLEATVAKLFK
jgi:thiol-disulfide isomerase/thioredoxin